MVQQGNSSTSSSGFTGNHGEHDPSDPGPSRLSATTLLLIAASVSCAVFAQMALEIGSAGLSDRGLLELLGGVTRSPWIPLGVFSYGLGTVAWLAVLRRIDLAVAYPLGSSSLVLITLLSAFRLGEHIGPLRWAGVALIVTGIWAIGWGERSGGAPR